MNQIRKEFCLVLIVILTNCSVGTQKQSCMYYVDRDYGNACEGLVVGELFGEADAPLRTIGINYSLVNCYTYLKKKKKCEREENQYLPGFYGMNWFFETSEIDLIPVTCYGKQIDCA